MTHDIFLWMEAAQKIGLNATFFSLVSPTNDFWSADFFENYLYQRLRKQVVTTIGVFLVEFFIEPLWRNLKCYNWGH